MHPQNINPTLLVRSVHKHLAVEAPGTQQRWVKDFGPVRRSEQHQPRAGIEAVQFHQQLIERLLFLIVPAPGVEAAGAPQSIELVDEDNGRRALAGLLEQVAHPRRADTHEHFHELRSGDREEGNFGFPRHRLREQCLAGARRPKEQYSLRHSAAQAAVLLRALQEIDDLLKLGFRLVHAGNIAERYAGVGFNIDLRPAAPHLHQSGRPCLAREPGPKAKEQQDRNHPGEQIAQEGTLDLAAIDDTVLVKLTGKLGLDARRNEGALALHGLLQPALDELVRNPHLGDLAFAKQPFELAVRNLSHLGGDADVVLDGQHAEEGDEPIGHMESCLLVHRRLTRRTAGKAA